MRGTVAALGLWLFGCNVFRTTEAPPVVIGASFALTGELGDFGRDMATGLELAESVVNENGGLFGATFERTVLVRVLDDETSVDKAMTNVEQLISEDVAGIIGPLTSAQSLATEGLTESAQIVQISPTAGAPELSCAQPATDRYFFRTISQVRNGSAAAIALIAEQGPEAQPPCLEMAIVHTDDATGIAYRDAVTDLFELGPGEVTLNIELPASQVIDYSAHIQSMISAQPDCATLVAFPEAGVQILSEYKTQSENDGSHDWSDFYWIGTTTLHGSGFLMANAQHPSNPGEGLYGADEDTSPLTLEYGQLRTLYNEHFGRAAGEELSPFVSNAYDAAMLLILALAQAETLSNREAIRDGIWAVSGLEDPRTVLGPASYAAAVGVLSAGGQIHYKGASSKLVFDEYGTTRSSPSIIWKVQDGAFTTVHRFSDEDVEARTSGSTPPGCTDS